MQIHLECRFLLCVSPPISSPISCLLYVFFSRSTENSLNIVHIVYSSKTWLLFRKNMTHDLPLCQPSAITTWAIWTCICFWPLKLHFFLLVFTSYFFTFWLEIHINLFTFEQKGPASYRKGQAKTYLALCQAIDNGKVCTCWWSSK